MSDGRSTLWRTSLCGVVMALAVFSTGCAVDASSDGEDDTTEEAQADLIVVDSTVVVGAGTLTGPVSAPWFPTTTTQTKSPAGKIDELVEPEPEPWHPRSSPDSEDTNKVSLGTRSDRSDDGK
jgi:hypothetical protein